MRTREAPVMEKTGLSLSRLRLRQVINRVECQNSRKVSPDNGFLQITRLLLCDVFLLVANLPLDLSRENFRDDYYTSPSQTHLSFSSRIYKNRIRRTNLAFSNEIKLLSKNVWSTTSNLTSLIVEFLHSTDISTGRFHCQSICYISSLQC